MPSLIPNDPQHDNSLEIQSRWNAGQIVPDGEYWCHQQIRVFGRSIVGNVTLRFTLTDAYWLLAWLGTQDRPLVGCVIDGLTIIGTNATGAAYGPNAQQVAPIPPNGLCVRNCTNGLIKNVSIRNVLCQGINASDVDGLRIEDSVFIDTGKDGVNLTVWKTATSYGKNFFVERCTFKRNGDDQIAVWGGPFAANVGTPEYHVENVIIRDNDIDNYRPIVDPKGLGVGIRLGCGIDGALVVANKIKNTVKSGICISTWGRADNARVCSRNITCANNQISGVGSQDSGLFPLQKKIAVEQDPPGVENFLRA